MGWRSQFAQNKLFYVAGIPELFASSGLAVADNIADHFPERASKTPEYPTEWWPIFPGKAHERSKKSLASLELNRLGRGVVKELIKSSGPATFAKAVLFVALLQEHLGELEGSKRLCDLIEIRLANWTVPGFKHLLPQITDTERAKLLLATRQRGELVFKDMADGYPVTKWLADVTADFVSTQTAVGKEAGIAIEPERSSTALEARDNVRAVTGRRSVRDTIRAAEGEKIYLSSQGFS